MILSDWVELFLQTLKVGNLVRQGDRIRSASFAAGETRRRSRSTAVVRCWLATVWRKATHDRTPIDLSCFALWKTNVLAPQGKLAISQKSDWQGNCLPVMCVLLV